MSVERSRILVIDAGGRVVDIVGESLDRLPVIAARGVAFGSGCELAEG